LYKSIIRKKILIIWLIVFIVIANSLTNSVNVSAARMNQDTKVKIASGDINDVTFENSEEPESQSNAINESVATSQQVVNTETGISLGESHSLQLKEDGTVWAWGKNSSGQLGIGTNLDSSTPIKITGLSDVKAVSAGFAHSLALKSDGTVWGWGSNSYGDLGFGYTSSYNSPVQIPGLTDIIAIAAGYRHSLALKQDGTVWAWGSNEWGQLGNNSFSNVRGIVQVHGLTDVVKIAVGNSGAMAIKSDGTVWAWGSVWVMINGNLTQSKVPVQIPGLSNILDIGINEYFWVILKQDGTVWVWGLNRNKQFGDTNVTFSYNPIQVNGISGIKDIAVGTGYVLALKQDGTVTGWGMNSKGQLGNGIVSTASTPVQVSNLTNVKTILASGAQSGAITQSGAYWAWGSNEGAIFGGELSYQASPVLIGEGEEDTQPPSTPENLQAIPLSETSIKLQWSASTDDVGVVAYDVYKEGTLLGSTQGTTYTASGLLDDTVYGFSVKARDNAGLVSPEQTVSVKTLIMPWSIGITLNYQSQTEVDFTWRNLNENLRVNSVDIYNNDEFITTNYQGRYILGGLSGNSNYKIKVRGKDSQGNVIAVSHILTNNSQAPVQPVESPISVGTSHTLKLMSDGTVTGWGSNSFGQLGTGNYVNQSRPSIVNGLNNVKSVSAGYRHSIAVKHDGTVWAWGDNIYGELGNGTTNRSNQPVQVQGLTNVIAVAAGLSHSVALKSDGTVWTWGYNRSGQLGDNTTINKLTPVKVNNLSNVKYIDAGKEGTAAVHTNGDLSIWGSSAYIQSGNVVRDQLTPVYADEVSNVKSVSMGDASIWILKQDGYVYEWKEDHAVLVRGLSHIIDIKAGSNHGLALREDGTAWSWGGNDKGQLGNGSTAFEAIPAIVAGVENLQYVEAGGAQSIAMKEDLELWAWGANYGEVLGEIPYQNVPVLVFSQQIEEPMLAQPTNLEIVSVTGTTATLKWSPSADYNLIYIYDIYNGTSLIDSTTGTEIVLEGLQGSTNYSFTVKARDMEGRSSIASNEVSVTTHNLVPTLQLSASNRTATSVSLTWLRNETIGQVLLYEIYSGGNRVASVSGEKLSYTVTGLDKNSIYSYIIKAINLQGNITAISNEVSVNAAVQTGPSSGFAETLSMGNSHTLRIMPNGTVTAWGKNGSGQLGTGNTTNSIVPVPVNGLTDVKLVSAGIDHSLAVKNDGTVWAWGSNSYGGLGIGSTIDKNIPVQVSGLTDVKAVATGYKYSLALKNDGTVWAWGYNGDGQLGNNKTTNSLVPIQVNGLTNVKSIAAGKNGSMALKQDGTLWGWGFVIVTVNGAPALSKTPVLVNGLTNVVTMGGGSDFVAALQQDGTVWVWGANEYAELGDTELEGSLAPLKITGVNNIIDMRVGGSHILALKQDGTVVAWGRNSVGQLGRGTISQVGLPAQVINISNVKAVIAGESQSAAITANGDVWMWGEHNLLVGSSSQPSPSIQFSLEGGEQDNINPTVPSNLKADLVESTKVWLSWNASSDNVAVYAYDIYNGSELLGSTSALNYTVEGLLDSTNYSFVIKARDTSGNESGASNTVPVTTLALSPVINLNVTGRTETSVALAWTESGSLPYYANYAVYYNNILIATLSKSTKNYTVTGLAKNKSHLFKVRAVSGWNVEAVSNIASASTDITPPTAPTLKLTWEFSRGILSWTNSTDNVGVSGYQLFSNNTPITSLSNLTNSYEISDGSTYTIKAFDEAGNYSALSNTVTRTPDTTPPTAPSSLEVIRKGGESATLKWVASEDETGVEFYEIYHNTSKLMTVSGTTTTQTISLNRDQVYNLHVKAKDFAGNLSNSSNVVVVSTDVTVPTAPTSLSITGRTSSSITLSWSAGTDNVGVAAYQFMIDSEIYSDVRYRITETNGLTYTVTGLQENITYKFWIASRDAAGNMSNYSSVTVIGSTDVTLPVDGGPLTLTTRTPTKLTVSWPAATDNLGVTEYLVYRDAVLLKSLAPNIRSYDVIKLIRRQKY
jgi:alpha-tubulin suppressor-like RCC1 family protein